MAKEIDVRRPQDRPPEGVRSAEEAAAAAEAATPARREELHAAAEQLSNAMPGDESVQIASFDAASGNAAVVVSHGAPAADGDYVRRALVHVQGLAPVFGFAAQQAAEFQADPQYQTTSSGGVAVHLRQ